MTSIFQSLKSSTLAVDTSEIASHYERLARRLALLQRLTAELARARTADEVADIIIGQALPALDAEIGVVAVASEDRRTLRNVGFQGVNAETQDAWREYSVESPVPVADPVMRYALSLVRASRPKSFTCPDSVKKWVAFGASVRAAQYLVLGAKARALTNGRYHVSFDDIRALAHPVLRHRVLTNFHAQSEGITSDTLVDRLLEAVPVPRSGM